MMHTPAVLTVRNLPPDVAAAIARRAKQAGQSFNRTVVEMLREAIAPARRPARAPRPDRYDDLDHVIGSASKAEADELEAAVVAQRRVDPRDWR